MDKQRGELSLIWCAVLAGLVAFSAMAGLFAMRYQRNLFAETWGSLVQFSTAKAQQTRSAAESAIKPEVAVMRKCTIDGKVVYSNVDCSADNPTSLGLQLHDSRGIEAPKAPPADTADGNAPPDLKARMIEAAAR